jgi:hypothetical protein
VGSAADSPSRPADPFSAGTRALQGVGRGVDYGYEDLGREIWLNRGELEPADEIGCLLCDVLRACCHVRFADRGVDTLLYLVHDGNGGERLRLLE